AARYPTGVAGAPRWGALPRARVRGPSPLPARQVDARPALPGRGRQQARDVTVTSRIAVTSMRAGDPRTEPQLSGRGGEDAPWRTSTHHWRPSAWATVTSQRGAVPCVCTTLSASAPYTPPAVQIGRA